MKWRSYLDEFGFGKKLGSDLTNELAGLIPTTEYYDRYYGENRWKALNVISLAIGQGEIGATPLQMANFTAAIANRGYYYTPHIVKSIGKEGAIDTAFTTRHEIGIDSVHFEEIITGMEMAVNGGSSAGSTSRIAQMADIVVCGKTGTAQNPHGDDHAVFVAFAPKENPRIAIAVYVENAGYGASYAAPIAKLMMEQYLKGAPSDKYLEKRMMELDLRYKLLNSETDSLPDI
jgi:penicillin-binding protein 2